MENSKHMATRRAFVGGSAAIAAGAAMGSVCGAAAADEAWDGEYDVVVVGAGMAGLCAAITVADEGAGASCLLIEKGASCMGNSPYCGGYMMYVDNPDDAVVYLEQLTGEYTPEDVLRAFAEELKLNKDWMISLGAKEEWMIIGEPDSTGEKTGEYAEFEKSGSTGYIRFDPEGDGDNPGHIHPFLESVMMSREGVTYMTETPLEELVQDPATKRVVGVVAAGKRYKANRGVIMCTGGFESDPLMMFTHTGVEGAKPLAAAGNTGDGHRACMKVGADFWHMNGGAQFWMTLRDLDDTRFASVLFSFTTKANGITVGVNGRRFYNDYDGCNLYSGYAEPLSDISLNPGYRHGITNFGGRYTHLPLPPKGWFIFDQAGLEAGAFPTSVSEDIVADGWAYVADTLEELAEQCGVPADELVKTVDLWNHWCEIGEDLAFYRPSDTLTPVAQGPFYAIMCIPTLLNTDGGPVRSAKGEILDPDGDPIPGLYSAGEFGSVWGHYYQGCGNVGECAAFGRISARSALANA